MRTPSGLNKDNNPASNSTGLVAQLVGPVDELPGGGSLNPARVNFYKLTFSQCQKGYLKHTCK